jgi:hypothetical protein
MECYDKIPINARKWAGNSILILSSLIVLAVGAIIFYTGTHSFG